MKKQRYTIGSMKVDEVRTKTRRDFPFVDGRFKDLFFFFAMINQGSNIATIRGIIIFSKVGGIHSIHI